MPSDQLNMYNMSLFFQSVNNASCAVTFVHYVSFVKSEEITLMSQHVAKSLEDSTKFSPASLTTLRTSKKMR